MLNQANRVKQTFLNSKNCEYSAYEIAKGFAKAAIVGTGGTLISVALKKIDLLPAALEKLTRYGFGAMALVGMGVPIIIAISTIRSDTFVIGPSKRYN